MATKTHDCCAPGVKDGASRYDLVVVGAGSAGFSAAITAAEQGAQVALVGHGTIGGTCVNIGCVPSKTLIRATEVLHHAKAASRFHGIEAQARVRDWSAVAAQKAALVDELRHTKYADLLSAYNSIAYIEGQARLSNGGVMVADRPVSSERVIITTGARPALPTIPGIETVPHLTSTTALDLDVLPQSMLVLGGGFITAELGQMFARAGVEVTIVFRSRFLPKAEPEIGDALRGYLADEGVRIVGGVSYRRIARTDTGVALTVAQEGAEKTLAAETVLVAVGREPNTDGLGLPEAGITLDQRRAIVVSDWLETNRPGVYAAGDVTGRDQFVYMAAYGGKIAARNALNGNSARYDSLGMPAIVFTDPQVATVGLTEGEARAAGYLAKTSVIGLENVPRAIAARDTRGLIKLVADHKTDRLLGAHVLAPEGADSIQTAALAIRQGLTTSALGEMIFPYLTTVEGLKLAALAFSKDVKKLSCCAG